MLKRIEITGLFDQFDYDIELKTEGITILTGPNGYGKTTILRIIHAYSRRNIFFLMYLLFQEIVFHLDNGDRFSLIKKGDDIEFAFPNAQIETFSIKGFNKTLGRQLRKTAFRRMDENSWVNRRTDEVFTTEQVIPRVLEMYDIDLKLPWKSSAVFPDVYLIREQRLIKAVVTGSSRQRSLFPEDREADISFAETIKEYAHDLRKLIQTVRAESSEKTQDLDSSFPARLFRETKRISESDFSEKFKKIKVTQEKLSKYGLSVASTEQHAYKSENATALKVYLDDTEKKLSIFDDLLRKLDAFTSILNEHHFSFKSLKVSPDNGFQFLTDKEHLLDLTDLSSGEQQEVVLLYELLFKVDPGTLVLIDEPEISLHVAWQKEFLKDLLRVIEIQKINVILATHSPQIINGRWDLTVDMQENGK